MKRFGRLYIDIDETIFARYRPETFLELRPGVISQLRILAKLFDCRWLTCWPWYNEHGTDILDFLRAVYAHDLIDEIKYMKWGFGHPDGKAGAVLDPAQPQDFWWLEDRLGKEEMAAIKKAGKSNRYIEVPSLGPWGFADACLELFRRAIVTEKDIEEARGNPRLFRKDDFLASVIIPA